MTKTEFDQSCALFDFFYCIKLSVWLFRVIPLRFCFNSYVLFELFTKFLIKLENCSSKKGIKIGLADKTWSDVMFWLCANFQLEFFVIIAWIIIWIFFDSNFTFHKKCAIYWNVNYHSMDENYLKVNKQTPDKIILSLLYSVRNMSPGTRCILSHWY